jgi:hypothetical protein
LITATSHCPLSCCNSNKLPTVNNTAHFITVWCFNNSTGRLLIMPLNYKGVTLKDGLIKQCKDRNLDSSGNRLHLVQRLEADNIAKANNDKTNNDNDGKDDSNNNSDSNDKEEEVQ